MDFSDEFTFDIIHYTKGCKCIKCYRKYYPYQEQSINIANVKNKRVITYELCYDCLKSVVKGQCCKCCESFKEKDGLGYYLDIKSGNMCCSKCI